MHDHGHHHVVDCNLHPNAWSHFPPHHQTNARDNYYHEHDSIDQVFPPPKPPKISLHEPTVNPERHYCAHHRVRTGDSPLEMYEARSPDRFCLHAQSDNRKPTDIYYDPRTPVCAAHQDQPPPYTYAQCLSNVHLSASEGNMQRPCRNRNHRGAYHCNETRRPGETKHKQQTNHHHHHPPHHQDQPHGHCHQHHHTVRMRGGSNHVPGHVSSHDSNHSHRCNCESARLPKFHEVECSCHPRARNTNLNSGALDKGKAHTCHCHGWRPLTQEKHGARWAWGLPLPAIVLGPPTYGPGFARG